MQHVVFQFQKVSEEELLFSNIVPYDKQEVLFQDEKSHERLRRQKEHGHREEFPYINDIPEQEHNHPPSME